MLEPRGNSTSGRDVARALHPAGRFHCSALEAGATPAAAAKPPSRPTFWAALGVCAAIHATALVLLLTARPARDDAGVETPINLVAAPPRRLPALVKPPLASPTPSADPGDEASSPALEARGAHGASGPPPEIQVEVAAARPALVRSLSHRSPTPLQFQDRAEIGRARTVVEARIALAAPPPHPAQIALAPARPKQAKEAARQPRLVKTRKEKAQKLRALAAVRRQAQAHERAAQAQRARARKDVAAADYRVRVDRRLRAHEAYPQDALARKARGVARLRFEVGPSGALVSAQIVASSGDAELDAAALAAVRRSTPFGAPPPGAPRVFIAPIAFRPP